MHKYTKNQQLHPTRSLANPQNLMGTIAYIQPNPILNKDLR